jgi:hypothetical protein
MKYFTLLILLVAQFAAAQVLNPLCLTDYGQLIQGSNNIVRNGQLPICRWAIQLENPNPYPYVPSNGIQLENPYLPSSGIIIVDPGGTSLCCAVLNNPDAKCATFCVEPLTQQEQDDLKTAERAAAEANGKLVATQNLIRFHHGQGGDFCIKGFTGVELRGGYALIQYNPPECIANTLVTK